MASRTAGQLQEIGGHIGEFAGAEVRKKVMVGSEKAGKSSDRRICDLNSSYL